MSIELPQSTRAPNALASSTIGGPDAYTPRESRRALFPDDPGLIWAEDADQTWADADPIWAVWTITDGAEPNEPFAADPTPIWHTDRATIPALDWVLFAASDSIHHGGGARFEQIADAILFETAIDSEYGWTGRFASSIEPEAMLILSAELFP